MDAKEKILEGLNDEQKQAVINYKGPTLIVAGAGSGKTKTITQRIAYMICCGVKPEEIMALTFTKKAAGEMRERILAAVGSENRPWKITMGTFHAVFIKILSEFATLINFPTKFSIYDENDSQTILKQIVKNKSLDEKIYKPNFLKNRISISKNNLLTPEKYCKVAGLTEEDKKMGYGAFIDIYKEYQIQLKKNGAMDFDDILLNTYQLLDKNIEVVRTLNERYRYIVVDEYQDTNIAQYKILKLLTNGHNNICVVGDDSQSIYGFRGAKIENILRFENEYIGVKKFLLERNYRSTSTIVEAANSVIKHNQKKLKKELYSENGKGEKIDIFNCENDRHEAGTIAREIKRRLIYDNANENDFAILYRNNFLSRQLENELRQRNIPYKIYGGQSFYKRKEILDMIAYIKFYLNRADDVSLMRIINTPARGIGDVTLERIKKNAERMNISIWQAINEVDPEKLEIKGKALNGLKSFIRLINSVKEDKTLENPSDILKHLIQGSHIIQSLKESKKQDDIERAQNIESLLTAIKEWEEMIKEDASYEDICQMNAEEQLQAWLSDISLLSDLDNEDENKNHVTLMTVHSSKGLEFEYIYIIGAENGLFPPQMAINNGEIEEERRLFYVALTRAKKYVGISWAAERNRWDSTNYNSISQFVKEIDDRYINNGEKIHKEETKEQKRALPTDFSWTRPVARRQPSSNAVKTTYKKEELEEISDSNGIRKGTRVLHQTFREGTVEKLEKRGNDIKITINFDDYGVKTLIQRFGNLTILNE